MSDGWHDAERGTDESAGQFGAQLFLAVCDRAERAGLIAIQSGSAACPMTEFVKSRSVPVGRVEEIIRPRHLHIIVRRRIEGRWTTDAEVGAGRLDQRLGMRQDQPLRDRRRRFADMCGKPIALLDREDGEVLEEGDAARWLAALYIGAAAFHLWHEPACVDHGNTVLALADRPAFTKAGRRSNLRPCPSRRSFSSSQRFLSEVIFDSEEEHGACFFRVA
mgnify:CR=1 FL=1